MGIEDYSTTIENVITVGRYTLERGKFTSFGHNKTQIDEGG